MIKATLSMFNKHIYNI